MVSILYAAVRFSVVFRPENGIGVVELRSRQGNARVTEDRFVNHRPLKGELELRETVRFQSDTITFKDGVLTSKILHSSVSLQMEPAPYSEGLYAPIGHSRGGVSLGKTMFWLCTIDNMDVQLDPSVLVTAFEVGIDHGKLVVLRKVDVPSLTGYGIASLYSQGNHLLMVNASRNMSVFDLGTWKEIRGYRDSVYLSRSGRVYRLNNLDLSISTNGLDWKYLRKAELNFIRGVHPFGNDDVLEFESFVMLGKRGLTFKYEEKMSNGDQPQIYVHPKFGVGVVWDSYQNKPGTVGAWLDQDLRVRGPIVYKAP